MEQSYANHGHHPVPTYIAGAATLTTLILFLGAWLGDWDTRDLAFLTLTIDVVMLVTISRNYIVRLQDRIIMLEMKVRCAEVLPAGQDALLGELTPKQIVALRFASDEELGDLLQRAVNEKMEPKVIKQSIKRWRPDYFRT